MNGLSDLLDSERMEQIEVVATITAKEVERKNQLAEKAMQQINE